MADLKTMDAMELVRNHLEAAETTFAATDALVSVNGDKLLVSHVVLHLYPVPPEAALPTVETFELHEASGRPTGSCDLGGWPEYSPNGGLMLAVPDASTVAFGETDKLTHAHSARCIGELSGSQRDEPTWQPPSLLVPAPQRLLTLDTYQLSLRDTARGDDTRALGSVPLYTPLAGSDLEPPLQLMQLPTPPAAKDGTPEPLLAALLYNGPHPIGRFQLATMSDRTLTARGRVDDPDPPRAFGVVGSVFYTVSATTLRTFALAALDVPQQLGELLLKDTFYPAYQFGAYPAGFTYSEWLSNWTIDPADRAPVKLEVRAPDGETTVATLAVDSSRSLGGPTAGGLERVGDLLVRFEAEIRDWDEERADVHFIVYDLRDPTRPQEAAHLTSAEVKGTFVGSSRWPEVRYTYEIIGEAFVFEQLEALFGFQVVDFREPSEPRVHARVVLPGAGNLKPHSTFRSGDTLYALQTANNAVYATAVDFEQLDAPVISARRALPGAIVGEIEGELYTYSLPPGTTLSKIRWSNEGVTVLAANKLPAEREPHELLVDDQGHLFVLHGRASFAPYNSAPRAYWSGLDIFERDTLEKRGSLELDTYAGPMRLVDGAVLIPIPGATLRVDLSDEHDPRVVVASQP